MDVIDVLQIDNKERGLGQVHEAVQRRENLDHLFVRIACKSKITIGDIELEVETILLCDSIYFLTEILESLVESFSKLTFALFIIHLVGVVHTSSSIVDGLTRLNNFGEKLHIHVLLLSNHDRIFQVEMDKDHDFIFTGLENCILDVIIHDVDHFLSCGDEAETVGVSFKVSLRLSTSKHWAHGQIRKSRYALVLGTDKLSLLNKIGFFLFLNFSSPCSFSQL